MIIYNKANNIMIKIMLQAAENFCTHQIRLPYTVNDQATKLKTFIASIDIDLDNGKKYKVYIAAENGFIQKVSKLFLEEDESDEETLIDMALETTNLIVGSAKVIAEDSNQFVIGTPNFLKIDYLNFDYDNIKSIKIDNDELIIAIKEID